MPKFTVGFCSLLFFAFVLSSSFFFLNPNNLLFPCLGASPPVSIPSPSVSLLVVDLDVDRLVASWKPSPSIGTFEVDGASAAGTGVLAFSVLDSEALIVNNFGILAGIEEIQDCVGVALFDIAEIWLVGLYQRIIIDCWHSTS